MSTVIQRSHMKKRMPDILAEIIADLTELRAMLKAGFAVHDARAMIEAA